MSTKTGMRNYQEWFSPEEMHEHSKKWISELTFIKDEQQFLNSITQSFAIKPLEKSEFSHINSFKTGITENQRQLKQLLAQVQKHMSQLVIMMDGVNQLEMEKAYNKTHKSLLQKIDKYLLDYRALKERGFVKLSSILKKGKEKIALNNPDYQVRKMNTEE